MKSMSIGESKESKESKKVIGKVRTMSRKEFEQYCTSREFYNWLVDRHGLEGMSAGSLQSICQNNGLGGYYPWDYDDFARCLRMKMETGITTKEIMEKTRQANYVWQALGAKWDYLESLWFDTHFTLSLDHQDRCGPLNYRGNYLQGFALFNHELHKILEQVRIKTGANWRSYPFQTLDEYEAHDRKEFDEWKKLRAETAKSNNI
jgi:hypothetical protein